MSSSNLVRNFGYAWQGLLVAWNEELNFRIQVALAIAVCLLGVYLNISRTELLFLIFMIGFVLTAELFNTALEELCDKFQPEHDPHIAKIKDLAAAAVLVSSLAAFIVGAYIFVPYLLAWTS